jgi:hypothetical protein
MVNITRLHIHFVDMDGKHHVKKIKPKDRTSTLVIKQDIARFISTIKNDAEYYYVVMEIEDSEGESKFRTIVPKTFLMG